MDWLCGVPGDAAVTVVERRSVTTPSAFKAVSQHKVSMPQFTGDWSWAQHHLEHGEIVCRASWTRRRLWLKQNKTLMMTTETYQGDKQHSFQLTWADLKARDWMIWNV